MKITLGSTSSHKLNAVRKACKKLHLTVSIRGVKTSSKQNEQPVGFEETYSGAYTRAKAARRKDTGHIAIGIESGIFSFGGIKQITLDIAVIVVITPFGRQIITTSSGFQFPERYVGAAKHYGPDTTVGSVITEILGGDPTDPHSTLSGGKISRTDLLVDALIVALKQI